MNALPESSPDFLPCPHCGSADVRLGAKEYDVWPEVPFAECEACGARGPTARSRKEAVQSWNERAVPGAEVLRRMAAFAGGFAREYQRLHEDRRPAVSRETLPGKLHPAPEPEAFPERTGPS